MNTKTRPLATPTKKFATYKETYRAKLAQSKIAKAASRRETIRRKEVRNLKKSFDRARSAK